MLSNHIPFSFLLQDLQEMENTKEEEELPKLNYPKLQHGRKTILLSVFLHLQTTKRVFIGERGTKGSVQSRASNLDARLHKIVVAFSRQRLGPLSDVLAGFRIWVPDFDETILQSQWLS